jgi:hypothetical protein
VEAVKEEAPPKVREQALALVSRTALAFCGRHALHSTADLCAIRFFNSFWVTHSL